MTTLTISPSIVPVTDVVVRPLTKVTKKSAGGVLAGMKVKETPWLVGAPWVAVRPGNALTGRAGLLAGQDLMKDAASV